MANKKELIAELTEKGIEFDPNSTNKVLQALLDNAPVEEVKEEVEEEVVETDEPTSDIMEEVPVESKEKLDSKAKNFANKLVIPVTGSRELEVKPGQIKKVVDSDELAELQVDKRLVGYKMDTKEAVYWEN